MKHKPKDELLQLTVSYHSPFILGMILYVPWKDSHSILFKTNETFISITFILEMI